VTVVQFERRTRGAARRVVSTLTSVVRPLDSYLVFRQIRSGRGRLLPPVFIVGSPRSGSTFLYQAMIAAFRFEYITNFTCLFFHSLCVGTALQRYLFSSDPPSAFRSEYGRTKGLRGPSECGRFWRRWFPAERDFVDGGEVDVEKLRKLRAVFEVIGQTSGRPLLVKNLPCGQRLRVLRHVFPEAIILFIRRDPVATALSLLAARERVLGSTEAWFSVRPRNHESLRNLTPAAQVSRQVFELERQIESDLELYPAHQTKTVWYEALCQDPPGQLEGVRSFLESAGGAPLPRTNAATARPAPKRSDLAQSAHYQEVRRSIQELYGRETK